MANFHQYSKFTSEHISVKVDFAPDLACVSSTSLPWEKAFFSRVFQKKKQS